MVERKFGQTISLLDAVNVVSVEAGQPGHMNSNYQAFLTGSGGALHAKINVEFTEESDDVSDEDAHWDNLAVITLDVVSWGSVADDAVDSFSHPSGVKRVRGNVVELTGAGAAVTLSVGV